MPEYREVLSHFLLCHWLWQRNRDLPWNVIALWADISADEENKMKISKQNRHHVYRLDNTWKIVRGHCGSQTPIWPPMWAKTRDNLNLTSITTLALQGMETTNRAIILDLGPLLLKLSYLTHASIQMYKRSLWESSIRVVERETRGFRVALAIEFQDHVLAFLSLDNVFQPEWAFAAAYSGATPGIQFPHPPPDVFADFMTFLDCVACWIMERSSNARTGLACEAVRGANRVWSGVGVYTISELFFMAGLSPFLTEVEVFDNPSRTARLCVAFFAFASHACSNIWNDVIYPSIREDLLAPTPAQRLAFKDWLYVYGKSLTRFPSRMADLVDDYKNILLHLGQLPDNWPRDSAPLYDTFEPLFIRPALEGPLASQACNLGALIFGSQIWLALGGALDDGSIDPLTKYFINTSKFQSAPTFLRQGHYSTLYPTSDSKKSWTHRATYTYQAGQKIVWSITPNFPPNSCFLREPLSKSISRIEGFARDGKLFKNIVESTNKVAIGPLEYCGNAHVIQGPRGREFVAVVRGDPQLPEYFAIRLLKGMNRRSAVKPGKQKRAMTQSSRAALKKRVPHIYQDHSNTSFEESPASSDSSSSSDTSFSNIPLSQCNPPFPQKRRRLCVDKHLVVGDKENIYEEDMGKRQRSCRSTST